MRTTSAGRPPPRALAHSAHRRSRSRSTTPDHASTLSQVRRPHPGQSDATSDTLPCTPRPERLPDKRLAQRHRCRRLKALPLPRVPKLRAVGKDQPYLPPVTSNIHPGGGRAARLSKPQLHARMVIGGRPR